MKLSSLRKPLIITIFTLALLSYGFIVVNAAYPLTQWEPGETLDPTCAPDLLDPNCSVATAWDMDLINGTVFNTNDVIGIGGNPEDFLFLDGLKLLVQGGFFLQDEYSPTATFTSFSGDLDIPGIEPGYTMLHYDGVLGMGETMHATFNFAEKKSSWAIGDVDTGARVGLSLHNDMDIPGGDGVWGVFEAAGDEETKKRYGFSFWTGGNKNSADHYEFDPVSGIDTKGIFVQDDMIQMSLSYDILDSTYAQGFPYDGEDDEWKFHEMRLTEDYGFQWFFNVQTYNTLDEPASNAYVSETSMVLDENFELSRDGVSRFLFDMSTGDAFAWGGVWQASDERLKTNIQNLDLGLDTINQLRPVDYTMISTDAYQVGFVAQEMQNVIPSLVNDSREYLSVNYIGVIPVLTKAVQEISAKIDILEQQTISSGGFSLASLRNTVKDFLGDVGNGIQNIFAKRVTTEELCIEDICFNKQEAETLKQLIHAGAFQESIIIVQEENGEIEEAPEIPNLQDLETQDENIQETLDEAEQMEEESDEAIESESQDVELQEDPELEVVD